jgi:hypothetical protein
MAKSEPDIASRYRRQNPGWGVLPACAESRSLLLDGIDRYNGVTMRKTAFLALSLFTLAGCEDLQIARTAKWSVDHMSYASAGFGGWEYGDLERGMRRRQKEWDYHNRFQSGGEPGWNGSHCAPGAILDPCRAHKGGRRLAVMLASQMNAPSLDREDKMFYEQVGKAYGLGLRSSIVLLEALNRAAVGDFGGLKSLGLSAESLASAHKKQGELDSQALAELSNALGLNPAKADELIQSVFGKHEIYQN